MSTYDNYPPDYRAAEVQTILRAARAGECVSVIGLSGSGKSNLLGFIASSSHSASTPQFPNPQLPDSPLPVPQPSISFLLLDCNRLPEAAPDALFRALRAALGETGGAGDEFGAADAAIGQRLEKVGGLCLLFDRFEVVAGHAQTAGMLRALRDAHKYKLSYVIGARRPLDLRSELAELFFAHTLWLGPLSASDTQWNIARYAARLGLTWDGQTREQIAALSAGYPSLLRAVCEAHAGGAPLELDALRTHPAVHQRVAEFWADQPDEQAIQFSRLSDHPLLQTAAPAGESLDARLTAKEHLLLVYFRAHPGAVCEKDELIRAVWPEDRIFEQGVRDDSLAQLIRRLREKIEPQPSAPKHILTLPGRGYRYLP